METQLGSPSTAQPLKTAPVLYPWVQNPAGKSEVMQNHKARADKKHWECRNTSQETEVKLIGCNPKEEETGIWLTLNWDDSSQLFSITAGSHWDQSTKENSLKGTKSWLCLVAFGILPSEREKGASRRVCR